MSEDLQSIEHGPAEKNPGKQRQRSTQVELLQRRVEQVGIGGLSVRERLLIGLYRGNEPWGEEA